LNADKVLFGGLLNCWIDESGAVTTMHMTMSMNMSMSVSMSMSTRIR